MVIGKVARGGVVYTLSTSCHDCFVVGESSLLIVNGTGYG